MADPVAAESRHAGSMTTDLAGRLLSLWDSPPETRDDPKAAFAALYTDPVLVNGTPITVRDMVARAAGLHAAFTQHDREVLEIVSGPGKLVIAFRHAARHTGPWSTPVGDLAPTGRRIEALVIDVLTVDPDGRISAVVVVADELSRLQQAGAVPA
jgi:hypothetical protein